ncbi:MAG: hypothetical protein ACFFB3_05795 [Candidatus Hodarchaeota archaeon]
MSRLVPDHVFVVHPRYKRPLTKRMIDIMHFQRFKSKLLDGKAALAKNVTLSAPMEKMKRYLIGFDYIIAFQEDSG